MNRKFDISHIEDYLENKLSVDDRALFESELTTNQTLQQDLEDILLLKEAVYDHELLDIKKQMTSDLADYKAPTSLNKWFLGISISLIIGTGFWFFSQEKKNILLTTSQKQTNVISQNREHSLLQTNPETITSVPDVSEINIQNHTKENTSLLILEKSDSLKNEKTLSSNESIVEIISDKTDSIPTKKTPLNVSSKTTQSVTEKKQDCYSFHEKLSFSTKKSCLSENTGFLSIEANLYKTSLDKKAFSYQSEWENLPQGTIKLYLQNQKNCIDSIAIEIEAKTCELQKEYVFDFRIGETIWKLPTNDFPDARFEIMAQDGKILTSFETENGFPTEIDLSTNIENGLPSGYYAVMIYSNNQKIHKTFIRILSE